MAMPAYITKPYYYVNRSVDDVQDILDDLDVILAAIGWTDVGGGPLTDDGPYQTPPDAAGRYFYLTFTRVAAGNLACVMTDDQARSTSARRMQISGTQVIEYYYSSKYLYIVNVSQDDCIFASLLSLSPESETAHNKYCVFHGTRTAADVRMSYLVGALEQINNTGAAYAAQGSNKFVVFGADFSTTLYPVFSRHSSMARRWYSCWALGPDSGTNQYFRGKLYNSLTMWDKDVTIGQEVTVPIDEATTGLFKVIRVPVNANQQLHAVRKE